MLLIVTCRSAEIIFQDFLLDQKRASQQDANNPAQNPVNLTMATSGGWKLLKLMKVRLSSIFRKLQTLAQVMWFGSSHTASLIESLEVMEAHKKYFTQVVIHL